MSENFTIGPATPQDVKDIHLVLRANRDDISLFQRSQKDVKRQLGDFIVAKDRQGCLLGCAALHGHSHTAAEILSVAVWPGAQGKGIGTLLVEECHRVASAKRIQHLWLATRKAEYFARFGYQPFPRNRLPLRVLLKKLCAVFKQPVNRWFPALIGKQIFMERVLKSDQPPDRRS